MVKSVVIRLPASYSHQYLQRCRSVLPVEVVAQLEGLLSVVETLHREIASHDEKIEHMAAEYGEVSRLTSVPGVGTLTALTYVVTLEAPHRFASRTESCTEPELPSRLPSGARRGAWPGQPPPHRHGSSVRRRSRKPNRCSNIHVDEEGTPHGRLCRMSECARPAYAGVLARFARPRVTFGCGYLAQKVDGFWRCSPPVSTPKRMR